MKRSSFLLMSAVATALVGVGCNNAVRDPIQPRQDVYHTGDPTQVFFDSFNLRNDTATDTPNVFRDANGLLHVTIPIRSVINKQLYVEYRVIFFDHDHQEIDRSPWRDKTLPANLPESVSITATNPRAEYFQVHFRYPTGSEM
jgi:hypothetical protein